MSRRACTTRTATPRRVIQRFTVAGALVAVATAAVTLDANASSDEPDERTAVVRTVSVTPSDRVEPRPAGDVPLTAALTEAVEARTELVAVEPEPEPEPEPAPAPEPEPEPEPEPAPDEPAPATSGVDVSVWDRLAQCESGGNWSINTGNSFYGGLQFTIDSWRWVGGSGYPHENSKAEQIRRAEILLERQGWQAWPSCSRQLGLR
ncbi:transglycosylase family protein [Egicoccus sp. AB-alg6-2]|uniref:transglycosylase family protein n=1 Tax=Egicoccus sp. AB-alg6-2 TaxID=3242692 RepID=UPI00359F0F16